MTGIYDPEAEQAIAGCAAFSSKAALASTDRLDAESFHDPRCWAVVAASLEVPNAWPIGMRVPIQPWWREHLVADAANVPRPVLEDWCRHAPCAWDASARFADRVHAAHQRRLHAARLLVDLEELGIGIEWQAVA